MAELQAPVSQAVDQLGLVRREQEAPARPLEVLDALQAAGSESLVADHQDFVDEKEIGGSVHGEREPEPGDHARGVLAEGAEQRCAELRELCDRGPQPGQLGPADSEEAAGNLQVLLAGEMAAAPAAQA